MVDRPILFSAPMVRALLAGTKTQTRRVIKPRGENSLFAPGMWVDSYVLDPGNAEWRSREIPFAVGDRLWVKETWRTHRSWDDHKPSDVIPCSRLWYQADGRDNCDQHGKARPSIFMPRWASRLTLTVTDVRVERLQDISRGDAIAEGLTHRPGVIEPDWWVLPEPLHQGAWLSPVAAYRFLWNEINGPGAWDANPWVVAVSFDVREGNIDA